MIFGSKKQKAAFATAVMEHINSLYGTALRMTGQKAEAEDLVHDTFVRALSFQNRFEPGTNLRAWLFKMMINLFINKYRRDRRGREIKNGAESEDLTERMIPQEQMAAHTKPEEYFFERLFSDDVIKAFDNLPHEFKVVVLLADINGFSYGQIAEILGIPVGTVMSRLHRGRRMLRVSLFEFAVEEGYVKRPTEVENRPTSLQAYRERRSGA
jgi:RNA polymerase sigma-70 factor (ECF subfamily)